MVEGIIDRSKGDPIIDYRSTVASITKQIQDMVGNHEIRHAIDAAVVPESAEILKAVVAPDGHITFAFPNAFDVTPAVKSYSSVGAIHNVPGSGDAREDLKDGKASAMKYVVRIADTRVME